MSDFLCIRLRDSALTPLSIVSWVVLEPNSSIVASGDCLLQELAEALPAQSGSRRIIILAPTEHLLITRVVIPEGQRRHLKQVLPFMVEEKIVDPIESMHVVMPKLIDAQVMDVGCINRDSLVQWLECLGAVDIKPDYLFADSQCVAADKGDWQLLFDNDRILLGRGSSTASDGAGAVRPVRPTAMALGDGTALPVLQMLLSNSNDSNDLDDEDESSLFEELDDESSNNYTRPESVALVRGKVEALETIEQRKSQLLAELDEQEESGDSDTGDTAASEISANQGGVSSQENLAPKRDSQTDAQSLADMYSSSAGAQGNPLNDGARKEIGEFLRSENIDAPFVDYRETTSELLAITAVRDHESPLNFLQGDFTPINANAATRSFMRRVVIASAACLVLFLGFSLAGGFYLDNRADSFHSRSVAIYKELFPGERIRDPVRQMRSKLKSGNVSATSSDFLPLLDIASRSLEQLGQGSEAEIQTSIKQLRYDAQRGSVTMELQMNNIDQLESYRDMLAGEGLAVDIMSANQDGDIINGRLQIGRS